MPQNSAPGASGTKLARFEHGEADQCVACGLCLPVCPTYEITRNENESPRGRIALIRGLATGQLTPDARIAEHLDRCTLCLACERACPAKVGYAEQMNRARAWLNDNGFKSLSLVERFLLHSLEKGGRQLKWLTSAARALKSGPARRFLQSSGLLPTTPDITTATEFAPSYPATSNELGRVALFTGCLQDQTDPETLPATITLLTRLGYAVDLPANQGCCGGLHLHSGEKRQAAQLAERNLAAFHDYPVVTGVASGCGAVLGDLPGFSGRYRDITSLVAGAPTLQELDFRPLRASVLVHEPCSHRNQLGQTGSIYQLLDCIPELDVGELPGNQFCCGGAGSYSLSQPDLANRLREPKLESLAELKPAYLVTTNIGCALHLRAGLADMGIEVEIVHPVTLLARQLPTPANGTCPDKQTADMV